MSMETDAMNTLTDEQVKELGDTLESVESPSREKLQEAFNSEEVVENTSELVNVYQDPQTGINLPIQETDEDYALSFLDKSFEELIEDDKIVPEEIDPDKVEISNDNIEGVLKPMFESLDSFSITDYETIRGCVKRYLKGEKFSYYNALPNSLKDAVNSIMGVKGSVEMGQFNREGRNFVAQSLIKEIADSAVLESSYVDMERLMKNSYNEINDKIKQDEYWFKTRDYFLTTADQKIQEYTEKGIPEIAERYKKAKDAFMEAYTLEDLIKTYRSGKLKVKKIEIEKFKRTCSEFNFGYKKTTNTIRDISQVVPVLQAQLDDDLSLEAIQRFVATFIKYTVFKHMDPSNFFDYTYMYFFIYNILTITNYDKNNEKDIEFHNNYFKTLNNFVHEIQNNIK